MLEQLKSSLDEICRSYSDNRVNHCQVTITEEGNTFALSGSVLDEATLQAVAGALTERFPTATIETTAVRVLRQTEPVIYTVTTNLTGFYAGPSWLAEMASQLLNGAKVELLLEEGRWAYVRQPDGYLGWVYRSYMDIVEEQTATHIICEPVSLLRCDPHPEANIDGRLPGGTAVHVVMIMGDWAQLRLAGGMIGWVPASSVRPLDGLPEDEAARRAQITRDGQQYIGVPYLWGGCTALGIDCSGFAQLVHRLIGVTIPRDADMQYYAGRPIEQPFKAGDLLFFGREGDHRAISHVGVSLGDWRLLHSSRSNNGVYVDNVQMVDGLRERFLGARAFL